jgi:hypothetical protein
MDRYLLAKRKLDKKNAIPILINTQTILSTRLIDLLANEEVTKLREYADSIFSSTDDLRRKKVARAKSKAATKKICSRFKFKKLKIKGLIYNLDSYCEDIEIIRWIHDKSLCDINFVSLLGDKYLGDESTQYITYVVSIDPPGAHTTLVTDIGEVDVVLQERISLMYSNGTINLREVMYKKDRTQFFFHMKYTKSEE